MSALIPVLRPKLPESDAILPYLKQIDTNRWYGNFGPLVLAFEKRLEEAFGAAEDQVTMVANGTLGLTVALQALEVTRGSLCLMPSWTFTATPAAALAAGLTPVFADVDAATQTLTPERAKEAIKKLGKPVGMVLPVSPFGAPVDVSEWDRFTEETGIPVVIDAAAAFDSFMNGAIKIGRTPVMISLHATKICGIGEGGLVLTQSHDISFRIRKIINFGFEDDRLSHRIAINAKPSEYSAAVGMAVLDSWQEIRAGWARVQQYYIDHLGKAGIECWMHPKWVTSSCNIILPDIAPTISKTLRESGVDTRRWWETGCHAHPAYRACEVAEELTATQHLGQSMLGIPGAMDMTEATLASVCERLVDAVNEHGGKIGRVSDRELLQAVDASDIKRNKA
ncbi:MAG: aminotransferase class I/II-fold pyridoxal phosphate-dependent enzyme [Rickettsiales bacterium]